jgi:hypothetical protein
MSKNNDKGTTATKAKKQKTPAQRAKAADNAALAAARLLRLQQEQETFNKVRAEFPDKTLSDDGCRAILRERQARKELDMLLACDMSCGGEPFSKRLMRFLGTGTLKGIAKGDVPVSAVIDSVWTYARTQDSTLVPPAE